MLILKSLVRFISEVGLNIVFMVPKVSLLMVYTAFLGVDMVCFPSFEYDC